MATFHLFSQLPTELRDMIWLSAIRPSRPAAHIFSLLGEGYSGEYRVQSRRRHDCEIDIGAPTILAKAEKEQDWQLSWTVDNPSAYLIDSGLWTACKESHEAMNRYFRPTFWAPKREEFRLSMLEKIKKEDRYLYSCREQAPDAPVTSCFKVDSKYRILTIRPKSDLFVLRPLENFWWWNYVSDLHDWSQLLFHDHGSQVDHIAIEVEDPCRASAFDGFAESIVGDPWIRGHLWIVDHSLERLPGAAPIEPEKTRHIFYGNGCRFVEYFESEGGWTEPRVAHSTFTSIVNAAENRLSAVEYDTDDERRDNIRDNALRALESEDHFGILACEPLGMPEPTSCPTGGPNRLAKAAWERKKARVWTWREAEESLKKKAVNEKMKTQ